jgi:hypothetical protein
MMVDVCMRLHLGADADQEWQLQQQQELHRCHFLDISRILEQGKRGGQRETPPDGCGSDACGKLRPPKKAPKDNATVHGKPPILRGDETRPYRLVATYQTPIRLSISFYGTAEG